MTSDAVRFKRLAAALGAVRRARLPGARASTSALAADPPFPSPAQGQYVYDPDNVLTAQSMDTAESVAEAVVKAKGRRRWYSCERAGSDVPPEGRQPMPTRSFGNGERRRSGVVLLSTFGRRLRRRRRGRSRIARHRPRLAFPMPRSRRAADSARQFLATCDADRRRPRRP